MPPDLAPSSLLLVSTWWGDTLLEHEARPSADEPELAGAGGALHPVPAGGALAIQVGALTVVAHHHLSPTRAPLAPVELDLRMLNAWLVAAFVHSMMIMFAALVPAGSRSDVQAGLLDHALRRVVLAPIADKPEPRGPGAPSPKPSSGLAGLLSKERSERPSSAGSPADRDQAGRWLAALRAATQGGSDRGLQAALGQMSASNVASAGAIPLGGAGSRSEGPGGLALGMLGGDPNSPRLGGALQNNMGLSAIGLHKSDTGVGLGAWDNTGRSRRDPELGSRDVSISSGYDKELLRAQIHRYMAQVRYCFERELMSQPMSGGKLRVRFTIARDGHVSRAAVEESTLGAPNMERCVLERISRWRFTPLAQESVDVRYPFIFHVAG